MASTPGVPVKQTQRQRILQRLQQANGEVSSPELAHISLQYNARIKELRDAGHVIVSRVERMNGQVHGYFRLVSSPSPAHPQPAPASSNPPGQEVA